MAHFWGGLGWGMCVVLGLCGWGLMAWRLMGAGRGGRRWLLAPAWGIAAINVVGGLMNLLGVADGRGLMAVVFAGMLAAGAEAAMGWQESREWWRRWAGRRDGAWMLLAFLMGVLLAVRFAASVTVASFGNVAADAYRIDSQFHGQRMHPLDDMHSYLVSVERLLQTGTLGRDPFNSRSMMSGLGTQHVINAMVAAPLAADNLHMAEGGVALAATVMAAVGVGLGMGLGRREATALGLVPLVVSWWLLNLSADVSVAAGLLGVVACLLEEVGERGWRSWAMRLGFLLAGVCSLKGTAVPAACVLVGLAAGGGRSRSGVGGFSGGGW